MRISTRGRYGLRAIVELAKSYGSYPVSVKALSRTQEIPLAYLEQIFNKLRKAKLVRSVRGSSGGFLLAKKPKDIKIIDILTALEGSVSPVSCVDKPQESSCGHFKDCAARLLWIKLDKNIREVLEGTTLKDLCEWEKQLPNTIRHEHTSIRDYPEPSGG